MSSWLIPGLSLRSAILLGLVLGATCGLGINLLGGSALPFVPPLLNYVTRPLGQIFLSLLTMTVVPLVFASLAAGVARLGDLKKLGRIGLRTMGFFLVSMAAAVVIGLVLVNVIRPGVGLSDETRQKLDAATRDQALPGERKPAQFGIGTLVNIVPRNPIRAAADMDMLGVIFFALLFGIGITAIPAKHGELLLNVLQGINEVMVYIIGLAMMLAPVAVFALIFSVTAELGLELLQMLLMYVVVVLLGLGIQFFGILPLLTGALARINPYAFLWKARDIAITAFSTSSSSATLATSMRIAQTQLGIPPQIAGFVLPLGATMNMNGTALFEGVTVLFLAQLTGVELTLGQQGLVVLLSVLTAIGAAGVPGGSIPLLMMVLASVGVEPERIGLILGVDRLLDMCRTVLNVMGDVCAAAYVAKAEGHAPASLAPVPLPAETQDGNSDGALPTRPEAEVKVSPPP
ncbi:MAG: dicarboxylate/amino acid:cation symporter [Gemmatales bacterium]|nr:dicarboxylate/amino acid:cation symporter [Gemmatales bacterium]MDW8387519.1 dicarboxylate/amino acid:cation symporter [Gemmatales bacterium]